jgi:DNA-binding transcriptional LysR family regulator
LSFKAAAEQLCVTPSAVSHQIKALEERLQAVLFERRTRRIALTQNGAALFAEVAPLVSELDDVVTRFMQSNGRHAANGAAGMKIRQPPADGESFAHTAPPA